MAIPEQYDAIVIGSGEAGKWMAWTLGAQGQRVITVEDKRIGGACPNVACLPSKNVVHSAKVASFFRRGAEFGIVQGDWHVDMAGVNARRKKMVDGNLQEHLRENEAKRQGIPYRLAKVPMASNLRAITISETRGFMKALIAEDDRILGFTAFGSGVGELLPVVQLAMKANLPYTAIQSLIVTHPTISEGLVSLLSAVPLLKPPSR